MANNFYRFLGLKENCADCGVCFSKNSARHKRCTTCAKKHNNSLVQEWYLKNRVLKIGKKNYPLTPINCKRCSVLVYRTSSKQKVCIDCKPHLDKQRRIIWFQNKRKMCVRLDKKTLQIVYEDNIKKYGTLTCILCIKKIEFGEDSLEHMLPISRGGTNEYSNLGIAHLICNIKKNSKTMEEYLGVKS